MSFNYNSVTRSRPVTRLLSAQNLFASLSISISLSLSLSFLIFQASRSRAEREFFNQLYPRQIPA